MTEETITGTIDSTRLKSFINRIETLEDQKQNIAEDMKNVYGEAKAAGFDTNALKKVIKFKRDSENPKTKNKIAEEQYMIDVYKEALGLNRD